ncbi:MAG: hypothetical protein K1X29_03560 [Bdellovibrionales bacterium]|nr:hypothetical protein [Bdellovibrionales bacterium]
MFKYFMITILALGYSTAQAAEDDRIEAQVRNAAEEQGLSCDSGVIEVEATTATNKIFYIASCLTSAYNFSSVLFALNSDKSLNAVPLSSAILNKKSNKIIGWISSTVVFGELLYVHNKKVFILSSKSRGIGDSGEKTTYSVIDGEVVLTKYELDNTFDGKINPVTIFPINRRPSPKR